MFELIHNSFRLRLLFGSLAIIAGLIILPLTLPSLWLNEEEFFKVEAASSKTESNTNPNVVANGLGAMANSFGKNMTAAMNAPVTAAKSVVGTVDAIADNVAQATVKNTKIVLGCIKSGIVFVATGIGKAASAVGRTTVNIASSTTRILSINTLIKPADPTEIPVIDSQLAAYYSNPRNSVSSNSAKSSQTKTSSKARWPLKGYITTRYGVPHRPYQVTHTGLDISSGQRSGVTRIYAFKPGRVVSVVYSGYGLGNHLIVDHGNGLTSVYGHLYSISVKKGQNVGTTTVLGYEGSTGMSTGTHLHFEIRLNGLSVNPFNYIAGRP